MKSNATWCTTQSELKKKRSKTEEQIWHYQNPQGIYWKILTIMIIA